ncbi:MAG: sodium:proton antiporter NhaD [Phaeodactylibacter sp.]|nr:sodium:proton antiporter NhaD [Phaeodactylibacter sp.]MCB9276877.1 sodium:proton antiporter NhaD [Lewinellaceae bacterium]
MYLLIPAVFLIGYTLIALEHPLHLDKSASAILAGVLCWALLAVDHSFVAQLAGGGEAAASFVDDKLLEHLSDISSILFFLLSAMTIVELIDAHSGFSIITDKVKSSNKVALLWGLSFLTFFLSAMLDNLTTAIVMSALLRKLVKDKEDLWFFAGMIIVAANAGGAWSPIGDVTTIMLWIGGQVTTLNIMREIFLPSLASLVVPLGVASLYFKGRVERPVAEAENGDENGNSHPVTRFEQRLILFMGVGALLFVPVFKNYTHLPPFMGILFGLGVLWVTTEYLHGGKIHRSEQKVVAVLRRIDVPSVLFFLGILLAVAALETGGYLAQLATAMDKAFGNVYIINVLIGLLSSVVDNVPLVAGAMGMYPLATFPPDHDFWELLAYCAGTGGSILIIGSAAGVATMGILKIDFLWYLKRMSLLALLGYLSGVGMYYLVNVLL